MALITLEGDIPPVIFSGDQDIPILGRSRWKKIKRRAKRAARAATAAARKKAKWAAIYAKRRVIYAKRRAKAAAAAARKRAKAAAAAKALKLKKLKVIQLTKLAVKQNPVYKRYKAEKNQIKASFKFAKNIGKLSKVRSFKEFKEIGKGAFIQLKNDTLNSVQNFPGYNGEIEKIQGHYNSIKNARNIMDVIKATEAIAKDSAKHHPYYKKAMIVKESLSTINKLRKVKSLNEVKKLALSAGKNFAKQHPYYQQMDQYKGYIKDFKNLKNIKNLKDLRKLGQQMAYKYGSDYAKDTPAYKQYLDYKNQVKSKIKNNPYYQKVKEIDKSIKGKIKEVNQQLEYMNRHVIKPFDLTLSETQKLKSQGAIIDTGKNEFSFQVITPEIDYRKGRLF